MTRWMLRYVRHIHCTKCGQQVFQILLCATQLEQMCLQRLLQLKLSSTDVITYELGLICISFRFLLVHYFFLLLLSAHN